MVDAGSPTLPSGIPYVLISILVPLDSDMVTGAVSLLACSLTFARERDLPLQHDDGLGILECIQLLEASPAPRAIAARILEFVRQLRRGSPTLEEVPLVATYWRRIQQICNVALDATEPIRHWVPPSVFRELVVVYWRIRLPSWYLDHTLGEPRRWGPRRA